MKKTVSMAYFLLFFFWFLGLHKFYLNRPIIGFIYLFTFGGFFIGSLFDLFTLSHQVMIANLKEKDKNNTDPKEIINKEQLVLNLAKKYNGILNPLDIAIESKLSVSESEQLLEGWVKKGYAEYCVSNSGSVHYEFTHFTFNDKENLTPVY